MFDKTQYDKEYLKGWRKRNKEKLKEYNKKYNIENKDALKNWREKNRAKINAYDRIYRKQNKVLIYRNDYNKLHKEKYAKQNHARNLSHKIKNTLPCEVCGDSKVEKHHPDYNQPLKVVFLCVKDHKELHKLIQLNNGRLNNVEQ